MGLFSTKYSSNIRLDGKTAIITGANTGIGRETVKDFFQRGAKVILACRNLDKANSAVENIKQECAGKENLGQLQITELDLGNLKSVRTCAQNLLQTENSIDLLVNNAGIMMCPQGKTEDGFELQLGTNHLGPFLLTMLLLPKICQNKKAKIINVSSIAHKRGVMDFSDLNYERRTYSSMGAYQQSKLANVLFSKELARRLQAANIDVKVYCLHPGLVSTELGRHLHVTFPIFSWIWHYVGKCFMKTPVEGAQTTIYCAVDNKCSNETGLYYADCSTASVSTNAKNTKDAERLWSESLKLVELPHDYNPFVY